MNMAEKHLYIIALLDVIQIQILPRYSSLLHNIGCCNIITPHIILPLLQAYNSTQHIACVNSLKK